LKSHFLATLLSSAGLAAGAAALAAFLLLKTSGLYLLIISLAIAMCIWGIAYRWVSMTGGDNGISGIPRPNVALFGNLSETNNFYYFVLFFFVICLMLMTLIISSPYGKTLLGIKYSENRMKVLGYNVWLHKYLALIIASAFAGLGGNLYAYYNTFINPSIGDLGSCMDFVLMVIIGGPGTMVGPCLGAIIIVTLKEFVSVYTNRWLLFLGTAYILTALFAPEGLLGLWEKYHKKIDY
jgi:branched-chain amino acid transport system permease protein